MAFLVLRGDAPPRRIRVSMGISLPPDKARRWADSILEVRQARAISNQCLENLIGKPPFSQTHLFGKFARTQMRPLRKNLYREIYNAKLTDVEILNLLRRGRTI